MKYRINIGKTFNNLFEIFILNPIFCVIDFIIRNVLVLVWYINVPIFIWYLRNVNSEPDLISVPIMCSMLVSLVISIFDMLEINISDKDPFIVRMFKWTGNKIANEIIVIEEIKDTKQLKESEVEILEIIKPKYEPRKYKAYQWRK